jgi:hypothetical protein
MDEHVLKQTNTMILNQVGTPPPTPVLLAVIELAGGIPEVVVARMIEEAGGTHWDLEGLAGGVVFRVNGHSARSMWFGGTLEDDGGGVTITAEVHRLSSLISANYSLNHAYVGRFDRTDAVNIGEWTFLFNDGTSIEVGTDKIVDRELAERLLAEVRRL